MSFEEGWAALNLEMPGRIPRTEYSAERHWGLVSQVTGMAVSDKDDSETQQKASNQFISTKGWNYDIVWNILIDNKFLGDYRTDMGHAEYETGGVDFRMDSQSWCDSPEEVLSFEPEYCLPQYTHRELVRQFEEHYQSNCRNYPDAVNMTGTYISLVSGLLDMFGWDNLLMAAGIDAEEFGKVTESYARWMQRFYLALADSDIPVIMIHDDIVWTSGPFMDPAWYRRFVFPHYKKYIKPLREAGKKILYTCDGDYSLFIDDIAACGFNAFVMEPTTDMNLIAEEYGKTHAFIGNADTKILLSGSREQIDAEVRRCIEIGKSSPGFFMAVGNHIPSNTPVQNALFYNEIYEQLSKR